ncbi:MAG: tetratricopeptide repeat protein [Pseudomonadota bacterium]|nr:tetratricopeptide repeat protein [Pseudomonadota bacterium]
MRLLHSVAFVLGMVSAWGVTAQESFRVELGRDGETLGDMRPVFLSFEARPLPAISPKEVARRYKNLFETSDEPEVRIDALNRLNHIRDRSGEDLGFSEAQESQVYREVLASYERILASGSYAGRLDEMLYQMAKAHALTGQPDESLQRLRQLVGLYPDSTLATEARFRLAEADYSAGEFERAEAGYRAVISQGPAQSSNDGFAAKARYMLGWSQFKRGRAHWNQAATTFMNLLDEQLPNEAALAQPPERDLGMIEDSFRILALMASRSGNAQTLTAWLSDRPQSHWHHLMYDRLADLHAVEHRYAEGVAVHDTFLAQHPDHPAGAEIRVQTVAFWALAGDERRLWQSRQAYGDAFRGEADYRALAAGHRDIWQQYARKLGDHYYAAEQWSMAAAQYEALAPHSDDAAALYLLAGDARLQNREEARALANYRIAAYGADGTPLTGSDTAGWAAIRILYDRLDTQTHNNDVVAALDGLSAEEQRYSHAFGTDQNLIGLRADLANRWLDAGHPDRALAYAQSTLTAEDLAPEFAYSAWLVTAQVRQGQGEFGLEERAWRQALGLAENQSGLLEAGQTLDSLRQPLATAIYRQAEAAAAAGEPALAVAQFQRVTSALPGSELAVKARFDAANTLFRASDWQGAINEFRRFRSDFPAHDLARGLSERLVHAYEQSGQPVKAAEELMASAESHAAPWPLRHRAAALFDAGRALEQRNAIYRRWLAEAPNPESAEQHVRDQRYRSGLIAAGEEIAQHQAALVNAEADSPWHSQETLEWAGRAALALGARAADTFADIALAHPLEATLTRKQQALESAQQYLVQAETFAGDSVASEVLYRRAELYRILAGDLMASQPPAELNEMETLQYQMLLEEEAFPLEEKAMALHARNHQRIAEHGFDVWIGRSLDALATLHPGRYQRELRWMSWNQEAIKDV